MELVDCIENSRFLGRELLLWLWYESDRHEGRVEVADGTIELWIEDMLTLADGAADASEITIKSALPTVAPEAYEALRQGKLPTSAKLRLTRGTQAFGFVLKANTLALSGVTVPTMLKPDDEQAFDERIGLLEDLESVLADLRRRFLELRTSKRWGRQVGAMKQWLARRTA
ncbi:MAG: hypothetical protein R3B72_04265 [Polyangiaceae bacterium]